MTFFMKIYHFFLVLIFFYISPTFCFEIFKQKLIDKINTHPSLTHIPYC